MISVFYIAQNNRLPYYRFKVRDEAGAVSLSDVVAVNVYMKNLSTGSIAFSAVAAVITDALQGEGEYRWAVGDTAVIGEYAIAFEFVTTAGLPYTLPRNMVAKVVVEDRYATGAGA